MKHLVLKTISFMRLLQQCKPNCPCMQLITLYSQEHHAILSIIPQPTHHRVPIPVVYIRGSSTLNSTGTTRSAVTVN